MTKDETMMSLWDYRGHNAQDGEGKRVYAEASKRKVRVGSREIENRKYRGKVLTYPKWFLDEYFHPDVEPTLGDIQDDELPF